MQSGAGDLLANIGIDGESASILASGTSCLLMLPCILMAMWLMDKSGRRSVPPPYLMTKKHVLKFLIVTVLITLKLRLEPVMYNVLVGLMNERTRSGSIRQGDTKFYWFFSIGFSTTCFPHYDLFL